MPLSIEEATAYGLERTAPALTVPATRWPPLRLRPRTAGRRRQLDPAEHRVRQRPAQWVQRPHLVERGRRLPQRQRAGDRSGGRRQHDLRRVRGRRRLEDDRRRQHWNPIFDKAPTLSIGSLAVNPADHSLWVGTGEANTNADSTGDRGVPVEHRRRFMAGCVGGSELSGVTIYRLVFDGHGNVYEASNNGLWRQAQVTSLGMDAGPPA